MLYAVTSDWVLSKLYALATALRSFGHVVLEHARRGGTNGGHLSTLTVHRMTFLRLEIEMHVQKPAPESSATSKRKACVEQTFCLDVVESSQRLAKNFAVEYNGPNDYVDLYIR